MICPGDQIGKIEMGGALARMGESRGVYRVVVGNPRERDHLEDPRVDGRTILRSIFRNWDVEHGRNDLARDRDK
jgi:hypothetical protein